MITVDILASPLGAITFVLLLFVGMLGMLELGRHLGARRRAADPTGAAAGVGAIEGAVFALLGLLVAFTFSGAAQRFDWRRHLVVDEANAIGTAYLRIQLLPPAAQEPMKESFRNYLDARIGAYQKLPDVAAAIKELHLANAMQPKIWSDAVAAARDQTQATMLLLPALNEMFDITTTRTVATQMHPPAVIFAMLGIVALVCSFLAGVGMAGSQRRNWMHMIGFAAIMAFSVYVILDLEHPRMGLIRVDAVDEVLVNVRESMK